MAITRPFRPFVLAIALLMGTIVSTNPARAQDTPTHSLPDLALAPTLVAQLINEGIAFHEAGNHAEAIKRYQAAHHLSPIQPATMMALANAYEAMGGNPLAIVAWNRALIGVAPTVETARKARSIAKEKMTQAQILLAATANRIADNLTYGDLGPAGLRTVLPLWVSIDKPGSGQQMLPLLPPADQRAATLAVSRAAIDIGNDDLALRLLAPLTAGEDRNALLAQIAVKAATADDKAGLTSALSEMTAGPSKQRAYAEARFADISLDGMNSNLTGPDMAPTAQLVLALAADKVGGRVPSAETLKAVAEITNRDDRDRLTLRALSLMIGADAGLDAITYARGLPRGPTRYRALSLIAESQGDDSKAQTFLWTALALEAENLPSLKALNAAVQQVAIDRDQATVDAAGLTASLIAKQWGRMHAPR